MGAVCRSFYRHKTLLSSSVLAVILCLTLISFLERWYPQQISPRSPKQVNDPAFDRRTQRVADEQRWETEYTSRVERVRDVCNKDEIVAMRRVWRVATNRRFGKETHCQTKLCPVIVDEKRVLFFCFVPKVASTLVKRFFLNVSGVAVEEADSTALHSAANTALRRVSPMYYPSTVVNRFFKIMFVRHPFDRLVSAFRSKAEKPREEVHFFYDRYFDPVMKKLRPEGSPIDKITFHEFIWYLVHTAERDYDEHWAPYWSRCDPCLVDYNFIGKLETAEHDFPYAFKKVGIDSSPEWWRDLQRTPRSLTLRYFSSVPDELVQKVYNIYKFDFELFGYSVHEFLPGNFSENHVR